MGHLDEQLKQLRHVQRDDEAKMKTYHQAKAQLYSRSKEKSSRKLLGVPMALMAALFIGFLLTYQWFGNHFLGPAVDEGDELITDDIEVVYVMEGTEIDWNLEGSNSEAIVINQPQFLSELKDILNAPEKTLKDNTIPGYPGIELRVEQVDGVISLFRLGYEDGFSYVWPADSEVIYQYNEALWNSFEPLFEADRDETEEEVLSFDTIGEALSFFGHENVEVPVNYIDSISNIEIMTYNSKPIEMLIHHIDDNDVHTFTFRIQVNEHMDVVQAVDPGEWVIEEHFGMEFLYSDAFSAANLFKWEEEYLTYIIEMYEIEKNRVLNSIIAPMFEVEAVEGEDDELEEDTTMNPVEKYNVFADFELYHTYGLAEERMFYHSIATGYVLGSGHLGHAVGHFDLFEINEAGDEVTLIRKMNEDTHYEAVQEIRGTDDWEEKIIQYMLESVEAVEELFFKYTEGVEETEISFDGQTFTVYPVEMDGRIHYFKEGEGLWMKYYNDQATIEFHGEAQQATRILNR